jgi:hypothetical protein
MKLRLAGWQRIAMALSVIWATVGAEYWTSKVNEAAWAQAEQTFLSCRDGQPRNGNFDACLEEMQNEYDADADPQPRWEPLAERALLPITLGWLGAYAWIGLSRRRKRKSAGS